jgi:ribosomal protein L32
MTYKNLSVCCIDCHKETKTSGLANHYNRIHGNDEELKKRALFSNLVSAEKSKTKATEKALKECKKYSLNPRLCKCCNTEIDFFRRNNSSCSASCSAIFSNLEKCNEAVDKDLIDSHKKTKEQKLSNRSNPHCKVFFYKCSQCENIILARRTKPGRKTC